MYTYGASLVYIPRVHKSFGWTDIRRLRWREGPCLIYLYKWLGFRRQEGKHKHTLYSMPIHTKHAYGGYNHVAIFIDWLQMTLAVDRLWNSNKWTTYPTPTTVHHCECSHYIHVAVNHLESESGREIEISKWVTARHDILQKLSSVRVTLMMQKKKS